MDFQVLWFFLIAMMLVGYAVLDGYDLGVGALYLTFKEEERRVALSSIGPFWDGNEVWLVAGGGALFAAFPHVYATVFSGFYLAFILFLVALILRATGLEFRNKEQHPLWRKTWDLAFAGGSVLAALLLGVALGNLVRGLPLGPDMEYTGGFLDLLNPFSLLCGLVSVLLCAVHGATFLAVKTRESLQTRAVSLVRRSVFLLPLLLAGLFAYAFVESRVLHEAWMARPHLILAAGAAVLSLAFLGKASQEGPLPAFLLSAAAIAFSLVFFFASLFPHLVYSPPYPAFSLTLRNASSSPETLKTMALLAAITRPLILIYTGWTYRVFKGPASSPPDSY